MSIGKEIMREIVGRTRETIQDHANDAFADGFREAENICIGILSKKIEELHDQIKAGKPLDNQEQFLLVGISEIKTQTENGLREFWLSAPTHEERW